VWLQSQRDGFCLCLCPLAGEIAVVICASHFVIIFLPQPAHKPAFAVSTCRPGCDSRKLWQALAVLYKRS
jgi:hypothetical protein